MTMMMPMVNKRRKSPAANSPRLRPNLAHLCWNPVQGHFYSAKKSLFLFIFSPPPLAHTELCTNNWESYWKLYEVRGGTYGITAQPVPLAFFGVEVWRLCVL